MDNTDPITLIVTDDEADMELEDFNWGTEIAKSLTLSAAQTAGVAGGFIAVAFAYSWGTSLYNRFAKKTVKEPEVHNITSLPKTSEN